MNSSTWFAGLWRGGIPPQEPSEPQNATAPPNANCSFCHRSYRDAGPLVHGPGEVSICGWCVDLCASVIAQVKGRQGHTGQRLGDVAHGRSGDKGNHGNIGIACRTEATYRSLEKRLTADSVANYFIHLNPSRVVRYELPNLLAFNFVLYDVLDGGASRSLRIDSQGKTLALQLLEMEVPAQEAK